MSGQRGSESSNNNNSNKNDGVCWMLFCPHTTRRRRSSKRRKKDLLGTPIPTPVHIRRKVYANNVMSSRYQGLEKEVYLSTRGLASDGTSSDRSTVSNVLSTSRNLQVYEGNVSVSFCCGRHNNGATNFNNLSLLHPNLWLYLSVCLESPKCRSQNQHTHATTEKRTPRWSCIKSTN